ncbi:MAG: two-component regulator propeller domain-containing protein [Bacteroidota bacterium]
MKRKLCLLPFLMLPVFLFGQQFTVYDTSNSKIPGNLIKTVNVDSDGNVWFVTGDCFTGGNVVCYKNKSFTVYDTTDGIPDRFVTCIAFDNDGKIWFGSRYHGISSFDGKTWTNYNPLNSDFPDKHVRSISVDSLNRIWVGTDNGLAIYNGNKWDIMNTSNSLLPDNTINSIAFKKKSRAIWIATDKGIMWAYSYLAIKGISNVAPFIYDKKNSVLTDDLVNQVIIDDSSNVWISCWGGIAKIDNKSWKWKIYTPENSKLPAFVEYIMTAHNDELWIASNMGLYILKNEQWKIYTPSNSSIPDFFVNKVAFDKEGYAWIATQSGLVKFSEK